MKNYKIDKNMLQESKKYIKKTHENCQNSILFHEDSMNIRGADVEWHKARMGVKIKEKQTLDYIIFLLEFMEECYDEVAQKKQKEIKIIRQMTLYE